MWGLSHCQWGVSHFFIPLRFRYRLVMRLLLIFLMFLSVVPARAQEPASDNELFAGYCFSALIGASMITKIAALKDCGDDRECLEHRERGAALYKVLDANKQRVDAYLKARRLFDERHNSSAWQGVQKAMDNGQADFKACMGSSAGARKDQLACDRMNRCQDVSRLPM